MPNTIRRKHSQINPLFLLHIINLAVTIHSDRSDNDVGNDPWQSEPIIGKPVVMIAVTLPYYCTLYCNFHIVNSLAPLSNTSIAIINNPQPQPLANPDRTSRSYSAPIIMIVVDSGSLLTRGLFSVITMV